MAGPPHGWIQGTDQLRPQQQLLRNGRPNLTMDHVVNYDLGYPQFYKQIEPALQHAAASGTRTPANWSTRWPTNLSSKFPAAKNSSAGRPSRPTSAISSSPRTSPSSTASKHSRTQSTAATTSQHEFEPGKCCPAPIYDNNTDTGEIELVSLREDDSGLPRHPGQGLRGPATHIVMSETGDATLGYARPLLHPLRRSNLRHRRRRAGQVRRHDQGRLEGLLHLVGAGSPPTTTTTASTSISGKTATRPS